MASNEEPAEVTQAQGGRALEAFMRGSRSAEFFA